MQAAHTISFSWIEQFYITVDNSGHGTPSAGSGWVDKGSSFSTTVTSPADVVSGVSQWVTASPTLSIADVEAAQTLAFSWTEQWYLAVANGGYGSAVGEGWYNDQSSVTVSIVSPVYEGGHWYGCTGYTGSGSLSSGGSGNSVTFTIGSASSISWVWGLDTASPQTSAAITSGTLGTNDWFTSSSVQVGLTAVDSAPSSLVKEIHYILDSGTEQIISGASASVVISGEGPHQLKYWAIDNEGHIETQNTLQLKIDSIAPVVTIYAPADGAFYKSTQVPSTNVDIAEANDVSTQESGYPTTQGPHTYTVTATDEAGNVGSASVSYTVDDTAAVAVISAPSANTWFNTGSVMVSGTGSDNVGGSGLQKVEYQIDSSSGSWLAASTSNGYVDWSVSLSGLSEGSHTVYVRATDNLGNVQTSLASITFGVDMTPPIISGAATTSANANGWYNHDVVIHFTASDAVSAIVSLTSDTTLTNEASGQHVVGTAVDLAGNVATFDVTGINIDKTNPVVTINNPVNDVYYKGSTVPSADYSFVETLSGIASTVESGYSTDEGAHTYSVTITDNAGNVGSASVSYTVDDTAAVAVISAPSANTWFNTGSVMVSGTGSDNVGGSGLQKVEYQIDSSSGSWLAASTSNGYVDWSVSLSGLSEGSHTVYVRATDNLGNVQTSLASITFGVDMTPPIISGAATTSANANGWYNHDVVIHFTASDAVSAIVSLTSDTTLTNEASGQHVVGTAVDLAGNVATFDVTGINIDKTLPTVTITNPVDGAYYTSSNTPGAGYSRSDALSGIQSTGTSGYSTSEGVHTYSVTATDKAGNVKVASVTYTVDNTAPIVTISAPTNGAHYYSSTIPAAAFSVTDTNPYTPVENGYLTTEGTHTYTVTATDGAGNAGVDSVTYTIDPPIATFTITVTAGVNGQIAPGTGPVDLGATPTYTVTPNAGYHIASITVNGESVAVATPAGQNYQFSAVTADTSIEATFAIDTFTLTVTAGFNGQITPGTGSVNYGATPTYTITPNLGYHIVSYNC